jgi:hypothetical protein
MCLYRVYKVTALQIDADMVRPTADVGLQRLILTESTRETGHKGDLEFNYLWNDAMDIRGRLDSIKKCWQRIAW